MAGVLEAEVEDRARSEKRRQFYVRNNKGRNVPSLHADNDPAGLRARVLLRFNEYRSAQINGSAAPGYSADQARQRSKQSSRKPCRAKRGFDYSGISFQEQNARGRSVLRGLRAVPAVCFSHSRGVVRAGRCPSACF